MDEYQSYVVRFIFQEYLKGASLAIVAETLHEHGILSPTGKDRWAPGAIDKLLSNIKYVPNIISPKVFLQVQDEKNRRSNLKVGEDGMQRKATRYHSLNALSGLLVCAECGARYRRITRSADKVVWRCANRVEHGKEICQRSPTIPEPELISLICETLELENFDPTAVREKLDQILAHPDGTLEVQLKQQEIEQQQNMSLSL